MSGPLAPLPTASPLTGLELVPILQDGVSRLALMAAVNSANASLPIADAVVFGADPTGVKDSTAALQRWADFCFGPVSAPHGPAGVRRNNIAFLPPGAYRITAPIDFTAVAGGVIMGSGRGATTIHNSGAGGVFYFNGIGFSQISDMTLSSADNTASVLGLDWDGVTTQSTQSNTIRNIAITGGGIGIELGRSGYQASECLFLDNFVVGCVIAGYKCSNYNALNNTIVGGNIGGNGINIWIYEGAFSGYGIAFEGNTAWDIRSDNATIDASVFSACRSESANFAKTGNTRLLHLCGISHFGPGVFLQTSDGAFIKCDACHSEGTISLGGTQSIAVFDTCAFSRSYAATFVSLGLASSAQWKACTFGRTRTPHFIADRTDTKNATHGSVLATGAEDVCVIPVAAGNGSVRIDVSAGARIKRVTLKQDVAGTGTINVGDRKSPTRFLHAVPVSGTAPVESPPAWTLYRADDQIIVSSNAVAGFSGVVVVEILRPI